MKKFFSLMIAVAFVFGTIGCDDKKPTTASKKTDDSKKTEDKKTEDKKGGM
jgi:predicted small lipoprotein YifL